MSDDVRGVLEACESVPALYRSPNDATRIREWCQQRLDAWAVRHEAEHLETCLGDTHLTWAGAPGEPVCLFLPGTNFNAAASTTLLTTLSIRCRVVCVDLPGQPGLSAPERPDDEVTAYERWMREVLGHVRQQHPQVPLILAGHSRGAAAALLANPSEIEGLVLASPAGLAKVRLSPTMLTRSIAWLTRPTRARSRRLVDLMAGGPIDADLEPVVDWLTLVAMCTRTTGAPGPLPSGVIDRWQGREGRVLVGERDVFFPPARLAGPARRLGATLEVVPDAGHLLVDQRPDLVAAAVSELLA
jgi:pimeloyl-ACP methyl ester carboxylesterase